MVVSAGGEVEVGVGHIAVRIALDDDIRHGLAVGGVFQFKREFLGLARNHGLDAEVGKRRILEILVPLIGQVQLEIDLVVAAVLGDGRGTKGDVVNRLQLGRIRTVRDFTIEILTVFAKADIKHNWNSCRFHSLTVKCILNFKTDCVIIVEDIFRSNGELKLNNLRSGGQRFYFCCICFQNAIRIICHFNCAICCTSG